MMMMFSYLHCTQEPPPNVPVYTCIYIHLSTIFILFTENITEATRQKYKYLTSNTIPTPENPSV